MILVVDTETTGFTRREPLEHPSQPHIVQLAAALYDQNGQEHGHFSVLIKPDGWTVPPEAAAIHGKTTELATAFGVSLSSALWTFGGFLTLAREVIAYNLEFDLQMLQIAMIRNRKDPKVLLESPQLRYRCAMRGSAEKVRVPGARPGKWPKLIEAYRHFYGCDFDNAHDAMADVRACAAVHFALVGKPFKIAPPAGDRLDLDLKLQSTDRTTSGFSIQELIECAAREHRMRVRVFDKRVMSGDMDRATADRETKMMLTIKRLLENMVSAELQLTA